MIKDLNLFNLNLNLNFKGEDPDAWWKEIEPRTNPNPAEDEVSSNFQKQGFANILERR